MISGEPTEAELEQRRLAVAFVVVMLGRGATREALAAYVTDRLRGLTSHAQVGDPDALALQHAFWQGAADGLGLSTGS